MKPIRRRKIADRELQAHADEVSDRWADGLAAGLFHNGVIKSELDVSVVAQAVFHGLNRIPTMVFPLMKDAPAHIYTQPHPTPRTHVYVIADAPVRCNLLIA